jgi:hypothetical protein
VTTWTAESERRLFDAHCPWCKGSAEQGSRMRTYRCACGAVALGAPIIQFEKVLAAAIAHFDLDLPVTDPRADNPPSWLDAFGIEFSEGGAVGDIDYYYWFKRSGG